MKHAAEQRLATATPATHASPPDIRFPPRKYRRRPGELVTLAVTTFSSDGEHWSKNQRKSMLAFHSFAYEAMNLPRIPQHPLHFRDPSLIPPIKVMRSLIVLFSHVFFLGLLGQVDFEWNSSLCNRLDVIGLASRKPRNGRYKIIIHPDYCSRATDPGPYIIGVLLHECCHIFISKHCCEDHRPLCPQRCKAGQRKHLGATGHGAAWVRLATHVEAVAKRYLDEDINLEIEASMCYELKKSEQTPIVSKDWMLTCHIKSREMLQRFRTLASIASKELLKHIEMRQWAER